MKRHTLAALFTLACAHPAAAQDYPYVGEIRWVAFNFAPSGWLSCDGQILPISENEALFTLYGTTYGGDGQETFALPDLRGRAPVHQGTGAGLSTRYLGEQGGQEYTSLTVQQMATHAHTSYGLAGSADAAAPAARQFGRVSTQTGPTTFVDNDVRNYKQQGSPRAMAAGMIGPAGGSQAHENMPPYVAMHCIVSLYGVFPTQ